MSCIRTKWSRTTAPNTRSATRSPCWTAAWTALWKRTCASRSSAFQEEQLMKTGTRFSFWARIFILALFACIALPIPARADVAPPEQPPGASIVPGVEFTQVRMLAESVYLTVLSTPLPQYLGQAKTEAIFLMRNLGTAQERMQVRFPLTFWNNSSDGFGRYPEIRDIQILV